MFTTAPLNPFTFPAPLASMEEDSPDWNCRTMGNRTCGPLAFLLSFFP